MREFSAARGVATFKPLSLGLTNLNLGQSEFMNCMLSGSEIACN